LGVRRSSPACLQPYGLWSPYAQARRHAEIRNVAGEQCELVNDPGGGDERVGPAQASSSKFTRAFGDAAVDISSCDLVDADALLVRQLDLQAGGMGHSALTSVL
jgi:hypothetical protein